MRNILDFNDFKIFEADTNKANIELPVGVKFNETTDKPGEFMVKLDSKMGLSIEYIQSKEKIIRVEFYQSNMEDGILARVTEIDLKDVRSGKKGFQPKKKLDTETGQLLSEFILGSGAIGNRGNDFIESFVKILQYFSINEKLAKEVPESFRESIEAIKKGQEIFNGTQLQKNTFGSKTIKAFFDTLRK